MKKANKLLLKSDNNTKWKNKNKHLNYFDIITDTETIKIESYTFPPEGSRSNRMWAFKCDPKDKDKIKKLKTVRVQQITKYNEMYGTFYDTIFFDFNPHGFGDNGLNLLMKYSRVEWNGSWL